jgi:hypothetical protein
MSLGTHVCALACIELHRLPRSRDRHPFFMPHYV